MGLSRHAGRALERGALADLLDPAVHDWPVEEAQCFAEMALRFCELRRKDRPDLGNVVLLELNRLRALGEDSMQFYGGSIRTGHAGGRMHGSSFYSNAAASRADVISLFAVPEVGVQLKNGRINDASLKKNKHLKNKIEMTNLCRVELLILLTVAS